MKKTIAANTFTPIYDELEDRLRLVINYQDIQNRVDFMLTRNLVLNLIPAAEEFISKYYADYIHVDGNSFVNNPDEIKTDKALSKTDGVNLELLRTNEELLLEVNFTYDANTNQTLVTFSSNNTTAKSLLDDSMMDQTFNVIKSAIPYIKWGISHHF